MIAAQLLCYYSIFNIYSQSIHAIVTLEELFRLFYI